MNLLHKLNYFISIAQIWHLPLVIFIIALCSKSVNVLNLKQLAIIRLAFYFNLAYIICDFLSARSSPFFPFFNINNALLAAMALVFDLLTSALFMLAAISWFYGAELRLSLDGTTWSHASIWHHTDKTRKMLLPVLIPPIIIFLGFSAKGFGDSNWFIGILRALYSFGALMAVREMLLQWEKKNNAKHFLSKGFFLWAVLQWLSIILGDDKAQVLGFGFSLIAKFLIITGLFSGYVAFALDAAHQRDLEAIEKEQFHKSSEFFGNILANTFHELNFPMRNLGTALEKLNRYLARDGRIRYAEAENQYEQVRAIVSVARSSYSRDGRMIDTLGPSPYGTNETRIVRVNNLLTFATKSIKSIYKANVDLVLDYGSKCYIECVQSDVIQIFLNLLKNAVESYPETTEKRKIRVKSYLSKSSHSDFRYVVVEIEDFGKGVDPKLVESMWDAGITSKDTDEFNTVRGQGLYIVREFINKTPGARIEMISPSQKTDSEEPYGTMFTILFPKKDLAESVNKSKPIA